MIASLMAFAIANGVQPSDVSQAALQPTAQEVTVTNANNVPQSNSTHPVEPQPSEAVAQGEKGKHGPNPDDGKDITVESVPTMPPAQPPAEPNETHTMPTQPTEDNK